MRDWEERKERERLCLRDRTRVIECEREGGTERKGVNEGGREGGRHKHKQR